MAKPKEATRRLLRRPGATVSSKAPRASGKIWCLFAPKFGFGRIASRVAKGRMGDRQAEQLEALPVAIQHSQQRRIDKPGPCRGLGETVCRLGKALAGMPRVLG